MATSNELIRDALVRHQIALMRFSGGLRNRVFELMTAVEDDLRSQIERSVRRYAGDSTQFSPRVRRDLIELERALREIHAQPWNEVSALLRSELLGVATNEARLVQSIIAGNLPVEVATTLPDAALLSAIVTQEPFEGQPLRGWMQRLREGDRRRMMQQVRIGLARGEGTDAIARRVFGTARLNGRDGAREITRRGAAALTRTAVNHVTNQARQSFYLENQELVPGELYVSTLDGRTTAICRSLDGEQFETGEGPTPPVHINCRSLRVPVVDGRVLGDRPAVAATRSELEGLSRRERRARINELTGQVPAAQSYEEFLRNQSRAFQEDVLGIQKARLFREGDLRLDRFVDRQGRELTLDELRVKEPEAFASAGL